MRNFQILLDRNEVERYFKSLDKSDAAECGQKEKEDVTKPIPVRFSKNNTNDTTDQIVRCKRNRNYDGFDIYKPPPKRRTMNGTNDNIDQIVPRPKQTSQQIKKRMKKVSRQLMPVIHQNELVWSYVRGNPYWPGVVEHLLPNGKYIIHFFGDYTRSTVSGRCIIDYFEGFNQFSCNFGNLKLRKAVEEAKYFLFGDYDRSNCYVCKVLSSRRTYNMEKNGLVETLDK